MAGQTITDRYLAAKHSIAGQGLAKSVCKATTEEMIGPKKKHLDYLVHCTNEPNVSIPHLANLLIERSQAGNWVVVYKALITTHHILSYGNERFTQYMASSNSTFNLSNFLDKSGLQGMVHVRAGYDMSPFIRRYAAYLNEKAMSYRSVAFDFCKVKKNKDGLLRKMNPDRLLKTIPVLQAQLDRLLDFDCSANDLTNGVINMSFMLLFRDLIRLFACYNNGIINLLEKYFDMNKKQCKDGLEIYKTFLIRMDKVGEFLKVAENIGVNNNDIPDLTKAPSSLLDALKQHLASMDSKKTSNSSTPSQTASNEKNIRSAVSALSSTSSSFGTLVASGRLDSTTSTIDETLRLQALAEEEAAMNKFKTKFSPTSSANAQQLNNPFYTSNGNNANHSPPIMQAPAGVTPLDLFSNDQPRLAPQKPSDDLLQLGNPFAIDGGGGGGGGGAAAALGLGGTYVNMVGGGGGAVVQANANGWNSGIAVENGFRGSNSMGNTFVSDSNFQSVFGNSDTGSKFDGLGGVLQPITTTSPNNRLVDTQQHTLTAINNIDNNSNSINQHNGNAAPAAVTAQSSAAQVQNGNNSALLTGDLDSSLASLAENLRIGNNRTPVVKEIQWNSPNKTGSSAKSSSGWSSQSSLTSSSTLSAGYKPMNQSLSQQHQQQLTSVPQPAVMVPVFGIGQQVQPMVQHSYGGMRTVNTTSHVLSPNAALMSAQQMAANNPMSINNQHQLLFH